MPNTWERGQHFEWAAFGGQRLNWSALQNGSQRTVYGAAVNIWYRAMQKGACGIN